MTPRARPYEPGVSDRHERVPGRARAPRRHSLLQLFPDARFDTSARTDLRLAFVAALQSLVDGVEREHRDVIITGGLSVVRVLMAEDLIDEYRLLTFPTVFGGGDRLFRADESPSYLKCLSAEQAGAAVFARYGRE